MATTQNHRRFASPRLVVGVGGSREDLQAFEGLLSATPATPGMAFVLVCSDDSADHRPLGDALAPCTSMEMVEVDRARELRPNTVYVIPAQTAAAFEGTTISPQAPSPEPESKSSEPESDAALPVDRLFEALADAFGAGATGVVLSGDGSDGARGLSAIGAAGGLTIAQSPASATHDAMPAHAIDTNAAELVLEPGHMPRALSRLARLLLEADDLELARRAAESERRFRATFHNAGVGIAHVALDGHWIEFNERLRALTGYERQELHELTFQDITHPEDLEESLAQSEALLEGDAPHIELEKRYVRKDGSVVWARVTSALVRDEHGEPCYYVSVLQDISEQKRLQEVQALLAAIVSSSDDAIVSKTLEGVILSWNTAAERIFGYTAEEAIGQSIHLIIPPELHDEESTILAKLGRGERIDHFETVRVAKDGRRLDISLTVSPIRDSQGRIVGASKVARDITERKRAERALEQANQRKDDYLAMLGHELRNPLAAIRTAGEVLRTGSQDSSLVEKCTAILDRQSAHMAKLLDGLLDVSRIERGKIQFEKVPVDLAAVLRDVLAGSVEKAREKNIELQAEIPDGELLLRGDPTRLNQIFGNLVDNALKFTPKDGTITVSARVDDGTAEVVVEDTGVGFSPEVGDRLFEAFQQGPQDFSRSQGGLGLGLALAQGLVELHGGTIEGRSDGEGRGAEFIIRLPMIDTVAPKHHTPPSQTPLGLRIVIIEDNVDAAQMLREVLEMRGHEVRVATRGAQGLEVIADHAPDVVLCDLGLPGEMTGFDVARQLRTTSQTRDIGLVALTGYARPEDKERVDEAGFDLHISKPVDAKTLDRVLAAWATPSEAH